MVRFGVIGTGKISEKFYQANRFGKGYELTAVYSRSIEKARQFGFRKGNLHYYDDLEAFAQSDAFDAAYVASPNCCHYEQVMTLLRNGKHVLCEKPLASNFREAEEMFQTAREQNRVLMEGMRSIYTRDFIRWLLISAVSVKSDGQPCNTVSIPHVMTILKEGWLKMHFVRNCRTGH